MSLSVSMSESQFITEVRSALAEMDAKKIPDDTITQAKDRFVIPALETRLSGNPPQDLFDNAVIAYSAERSFKAWLARRRMADSDLQVSVKAAMYKDNLEERTNEMLSLLGVSRPNSSARSAYTTRNETDYNGNEFL